MAQIVPEGNIAAEVADIRMIPSEVAAEATVPTGGVAADAPRIVDQVEADAPARPVSEVTVVVSSLTPAGGGHSKWAGLPYTHHAGWVSQSATPSYRHGTHDGPSTG